MRTCPLSCPGMMILPTNQPKIYLPDVVGRGYGTFWRFRGRYRVVKGSRASKKSTTTALNFIFRMMQIPGSNLLVIRKTYRTLHDSCFTQLLWAIHRLKVDAFWSWKESPLEITYKPTGQKIYFRGLDDPLKVTSITVETGSLCWMWIEEAYEIMDESDFNTVFRAKRETDFVITMSIFPARQSVNRRWNSSLVSFVPVMASSA